MHVKEFIARCDQLELHATERGFLKPKINNYLRFVGKDLHLKVEMKTGPDPMDETLFSPPFETTDATSDELERVFEKATAWIDAQETPEQRRRKDFIRKMAHVTEEAEELGYDFASILRGHHTNLLEHHA